MSLNTIIKTDENTYMNCLQSLGSGCYGNVTSGFKLISTVAQKTLESKYGSPVAIKTLKMKKFFLKECNNIRHIKDKEIPHATRYRDFKIAPSQLEFNIVMDLIPGETLHQIGSKLSWTQVVSIADQMLEFLVALEKINLLHGDIKSSNAIYEPSANYLTICDFGLSCHSKSVPVVETKEAPVTIQNIGYRAPEILLRFGHTTRADLWSFGAVLYEIVTDSSFIPGITEDYIGMADQARAEAIQHNIIQRVFRRIDLPLASTVEKWTSPYSCPWKIENGAVVWKTPPQLGKVEWEALFKEGAAEKNGPANEVNALVSILKKIFCFEKRASAEEIASEFKNLIQQDIRFHILGLEKNHKLLISSDKITVVYDNSLRVHRSCIHVPKNPNHTYLMTLMEGSKVLFKDISICARGDQQTITLLELLQTASIQTIPENARFVPGTYCMEELFDPSVLASFEDLS